MRGDFDQLRKVLMLEGEPRYVPKAELWIDRKIMSDFLKREVKDAVVDTENVVEFWYRAGYDYAHIVPSYTLHERVEWVNEHTGAITSWDEFKTFPWPTIDEVDFTPVENAVRVLPKKMKVISGTLSGVFEESWMLMGFETFALKLIEDYSLVKAVVDRVGALMYEIIDKVTQIDGVGAIWHSDDIAYKTSTLLSPEHYRKLIFPWYRHFGSLVHARELPFMYHSDGCLWNVLNDLVDCGFNSIHPVEPLSMDIFELKNRFGDSLCIIGNIEVDSFLTRGTPQMIEIEVKRKIEGLAPGGGYCCGSSNTIPEWVPYENYVSMINAIEKYGSY